MKRLDGTNGLTPPSAPISHFISRPSPIPPAYTSTQTHGPTLTATDPPPPPLCGTVAQR